MPDRDPEAAPARAAVAGSARTQSRPRGRGVPPRPSGPSRPAAPARADTADDRSAEPAAPSDDGDPRRPACTLAQMRRFIKSRPYVPLHELRRRFEIGGSDDDVARVGTRQGALYVGLPDAEAGYLAELVDSGEVGVELLLDPTGPAVIGVYPMRPVARQ